MGRNDNDIELNDVHFANLAELETALEPFWPKHMPERHAYTTEHMAVFMDYLGNPQHAAPAIHVAGTSGKTSTAMYAAALLKASGKRVGLLISPHLERITERVQIDLRPLSERQFCDDFAIFMELARQSGIALTYAELLYGFGYWEFARERVDCMVVETGMGGLLDATNVITREDKMCVITDIGFDHMNVLGTSIADIAAHKAGIIHRHNAVFCHPQAEPAIQVIQRVCRQKQADLHIVPDADPDYLKLFRDSKDSAIDHLPLFQERNLSLVAAAVDYFLQRLNRDQNSDMHQALALSAIETAARLSIPGRMEIHRRRGKILILDSAHNPQKLQALRESIVAQFPEQRVAALVAFIEGRGRSLQDALAELRKLATTIIATTPAGVDEDGLHTWQPVAAIVQAAGAAGLPADPEHVQAVADYKQAWQTLLRRPEPILLVTGSLYLYQYIHPLIRQATQL